MEATDAARDILLMYFEMACGTAGFSHAVNHGIRFDPLKFVDASRESRLGGVPLDLLHEGSAIAILCFFYDLWSEEQHLSGPRAQPYQKAPSEGRLSAFPDIEHVIRCAISRGHIPIEDGWFDDAVEPIYRKYVLGLQRLAVPDRSA